MKNKAITKDMDFKTKVSQFCTYYLGWLVLLIAFIALVISLVSSIKESKREVLFSGALINVNSSDAGVEFLSDDLFSFLNGDDKKQQVQLISDAFIDFEDEQYTEVTYANYMRLLGQIGAGYFDYIILDDYAITDQDLCLGYADMSQFLSADLLNRLQVLDIVSDDGTYPGAIKLNNTYFYNTYLSTNKNVYLVFMKNSKNLNRAESFVNYLMGE